MMYLLTKSETLNDNVSVALTGVTDAINVIDGDITTAVETANREPTLKIDLGSAKVIDTAFLKGDNLQDYDISASTDNITFTDLETDITVPAHGNSFVTFTNTTAYRYWRLSFSRRGASDPNYKIHEVYLASLLLDLNTDEKRPLHYRPSIPRDGVVAYETYNQNLVQCSTEGAEKTTLTFQWEYLDTDVADALEALRKGAPHAPELTVYPLPNAEPDKIYIVKWKPEFGFRFTGPFSELGKSGQAVFEEI